MEKAAGGKRAWHDDRFFRCKTWIYAYKPYFGSTERTIFCICKRKDRRDELVYAGWQIRQLMEKEAGWDKQLEEKDKKVVAGAYHSKENSSVYWDGLCDHPAFRCF